MDETHQTDDAAHRDVVTITTPITPVIVKAVLSSQHHDKKPQRSAADTVLVLAQKSKPTTSTALSQPVIIKDTSSIIVQNYGRPMHSAAQSVIRSTKAEEYKILCSSPVSAIRPDNDISNDSSLMTTTSDNSTDSCSVMYASSGDKSETWPTPPLSIFIKSEYTEDSVDSKTEESSPSPSICVRENPRDARNKAEKHRRDKLNGSIRELASLVPLVVESSKKVDKTGVLRFTAHDLRKEHVFGESMSSCHLNLKPKLAQAFIDMMGGCLLTTTCKGIVIVISANVEQYLGHCQTDLIGTNILDLCHPDDVEKLKMNLMPHSVALGPNGQLLPNNLSDKEFTMKEKPRCFQIRLARAVPRSESPQYEVCRVNGSLRRSDRVNSVGNATFVRRHRNRVDEVVSISGNDVVFIGLIHIVKEMYLSERLIEGCKDEYRTRHLIDGRIVSCDQRISVVAGYLTSEISGVSAFTFMHKEDVRWVIIALRQMYDRNKQVGESCYRLITRTGEFIYLKTTGYLEISSENAVQSFVCTNSRISEKEGQILINKMKEKYSVIVDDLGHPFNYGNSGEATVEDPQKLEQVIMHLITNLPYCPPNSTPCPSPNQVTLSIIPPKPSSIKSTIEKSVSVISKTLKLKGCGSGSIVKPSDKTDYIYKSEFSKIPIVKKAESLIENKIEMDDVLNQKKMKELKNEKVLTNLAEKVKVEPIRDAFNPALPPTIDKAIEEALNIETNTDNSCHPIYLKNETVDIPYPNDISNSKSYLLDISSYEASKNPTLHQTISPCSSTHNVTTIPNDNSLSNLYGTSSFASDQDFFKMQSVDCDFIMNSDVKPNILTSTDALLGSSILGSDELYGFESPLPFSSHMGILKRTRNDSQLNERSDSIAKRRLHSDMNSMPNNSLQSDDDFADFQVNPNLITQTNVKGNARGLEQFIEELTDPNADLDLVVPRSLAALETSISRIDGRVSLLNNTQAPVDPQRNLSDIIVEQEEHRTLFESITLDHRIRNGDSKSVDEDHKRSLSPTQCLED